MLFYTTSKPPENLCRTGFCYITETEFIVARRRRRRLKVVMVKRQLLDDPSTTFGI